MIYKKLLLILIHSNIIFTMSEVVQLGVQLVAISVQQAAETKMQTEGYKQELINTQKAITDLIEKEKAKTNNLIAISDIKNELIKNIDNNKNENQLIIDSLYKIIYTAYKNFIILSKEFKEKYNTFLLKKKENSTNILFKIGIISIQEVLNEYISFLKQYNYQLQNVSQKIQSNNQFNSVYIEMPENDKFVDSGIDINELIKNLDTVLSNIDQQADTLIRSRDLLVNNNVVSFNTISNKILDAINNLESSESNKDVNDSKQIFYDLKEQLGVFKDKLFSALTEFTVSQSEAKSLLYKTIALLDINYNKIKNIIMYINNTIENNNYTINDFVKELYKSLLENKKIIKNSKNSYFESLAKNNIGFADLINGLNQLFSFMENNSKKLDLAILHEFLYRIRTVVFSYENGIATKNKDIESGVVFLSYLDNFLIELKENAIKFQSNIKNRSVKQNEVKFNIYPEPNIFDQIYSKNKNHKKKHKNNNSIHIKIDNTKDSGNVSSHDIVDKSKNKHKKSSSKNHLIINNKKGVK